MAFFTYKPDGRLLALITCLCLTLGVVACQIESDQTTPITQSSNNPLPSDPNRDYQILSVKFAGIPVENVTVDQLTRTITVSIPAGFVGNDLKPVVTLTENTTLVSGLGSEPNRPFRLVTFCYCNTQPTAIIKPVGATANQIGVEYTIVAQSIAPLTLKQPTTPLIVPLSEITAISLPVDNPYGSPSLVAAFVQPLNGGTPVLIQGDPTRAIGCVWFSCEDKEPGRLRFTFNPARFSSIVAGDYLLTLQQQNGTRLTQAVRFVRGEFRLNVNEFFGYAIDQNQSEFTLQGVSLYAEEIAGILTAPNGQSWTLKPIASAPNGVSLTMGVPRGLTPGYYALQLLRNGTELAACLRFSVRQSPAHPIILSMNGGKNCLAKEPVALKRSVTQSFMMSYAYTSSGAGYIPPSATLKLTGITDLNRSYAVPVVFPVEAFPRFTLPETVLPGSYRATVEIVVDGKTLESEPFEQPVIVQ